MKHLPHSVSKSKLQEPIVQCSRCGHLETEHGKSGTRPCLAMVGDTLERQFCSCDELKIAAAAGRAA